VTPARRFSSVSNKSRDGADGDGGVPEAETIAGGVATSTKENRGRSREFWRKHCPWISVQQGEALLYGAISSWANENGGEVSPRDRRDKDISPFRHDDVAFVRFLNDFSDAFVRRRRSSISNVKRRPSTTTKHDGERLGQQSFVLVRCKKVRQQSFVPSLRCNKAALLFCC
jgi:hypothetical protein